jgi:predicted RNase H-like HicB family nuclease
MEIKKDLAYYMGLNYPNEAGKKGFAAMIPLLPGCMTQADVFAGLWPMIQDAKRLWLTVAIEDGMEIPEPSNTEENDYVDLKMIFEDWRKDGKSVYQSAEGAPLSYGDFHSGSTFPGKIKLDQEEIDELKKAIAGGFEPNFRIIFPNN